MKKRIQSSAGRLLSTLFVTVPLIGLLAAPFLVGGVVLGAYMVYSRDLPPTPDISYQPKTVSTFYSDDGTVIGIFYKEKRYVVEPTQIPPHVVKAFLAAEDARFFEHNGIDWIRILGATGRNLLARRVTQGGSTITMQVTRNFLLTRERRLSRKIKELILAPRLEQSWGKEKILHVYLNEIYLGEGSYGVEAAARGYFDKPVEHLTLAEGALLAGLVAGPTVFNPFKNEELALQKQRTVLRRMLKAEFISQEEYDAALAEKPAFRREFVRPFDIAPDFSEVVRRYIVKKYGSDKLYNEGLKVFTTCRVDYQKKAVESLERGLEEIKARQKNLAILRTVPQAEMQELLQKRSNPDLVEGQSYQGLLTRITKRDKTTMLLHVALSKKVTGLVKLDKPDAHYKVGNVLALQFESFQNDTPMFTLDKTAKLEGAVVCIENKTGYVRALVGGTPGDTHKFNRAVQGKRQPGSVFKPIIYATAIEQAGYSPATVIIDDNIIVDFDEQDVEWMPKNSGGNFLGPLSLRRALELSRNICTIKVLMDVQLDRVINTAHKMGIESELGKNLSLSLGTSELNVLEITSAYTVFPNSGVLVDPVMVKRIEDRLGNVLEDNEEIPILDESEIPRPQPRPEFAGSVPPPPPRPKAAAQENANTTPSTHLKTIMEEGAPIAEVSTPKVNRAHPAISPQTAYIMTSLLQGGVREGTGARLNTIIKRRDLAGKTGTTNQAADAWFMGFNPEFTTGVWVGYDEKRSLGDREEGSRAALPIWGYFMKSVLENRPEREFVVPNDITFKDMRTVSGAPTTGYFSKIVREPVYTPFIDQTLALCPLDTPETLAQYGNMLLAPAYADQAPAQQPGAIPGNAPRPTNPMDGRNLFPGASYMNTPTPAPTVYPQGMGAEGRNMSYAPGVTSPPAQAKQPKPPVGAVSPWNKPPAGPVSSGRR